MNRLRQALATGFVFGALWGGLESLVLLLGPWFAFWAELGRRPPLNGVNLASVVLQAAGTYALLGALGCSLLMLLLSPFVGRARGASGGPAEARSLLAPRLMVGAAVTLNLFWHTKQLWAFSWGLPFLDPKRLALSAVWVLVGGVVSVVLVRPGGLLRVPGRVAVVLSLLVLMAAVGWARPREASLGSGGVTPPEGAPNVLFVVVDALRQDRLGCYGYEARGDRISPAVDQLARDGVVFEDATAQAPFTWTSFGSFLTGKYARQHGLIKMWPDQHLNAHSNRTLAQALQDEGYATGAFLTGTLSNNTGLLNGFDTYFETIVGHEAVNRHSKWSVVRSRMLFWILLNKSKQFLDPRLVNSEAMSWIEDHADRPFFALVHYYSTHTPYDPPPPYDTLYDPDYDGYFHPFRQKHGQWIMRQEHSESGLCPHDGQPVWSCEHFDTARDVEHINALYDGGVSFADEMFGDLMAQLERLEILDNTLVIFTSDHGEELFDHGLFEHDWMFETNLRVPLIMRLPGRKEAGTRVPWPVELRDIPETVLHVTATGTLDPSGELVLEYGEDRQILEDSADRRPGRSLLPDMQGDGPGVVERTVFAENVRYVSLRTRRYKLVVNRFTREARLFDLASGRDPAENQPLDLDDRAYAEIAQALRERLQRYDARMPVIPTGGVGGMDPALLRALIALGYVGEATGSVLTNADELEAGELKERLGETQFLGSNEILEEDIYTRPFQWPPGFNGAAPAGTDSATPTDPSDGEG